MKLGNLFLIPKMTNGGMCMGKVAKNMIALVIALLIIMTSGNIAFAASTTGNGTLVFSPNPSATYDDSGVTYVRMISLKHNGANNGTLLCFFDQQIVVNGQGVWPVYKSTDGGNTWQHISDIRDNVYGTTHKMNPCIFELPKAIGNLQEGTILVAGLLLPEEWNQSQITLFASTDLANSFSPISVVDVGGPNEYDRSPTSTTTTVWEPFLGIDGNGNLACYYSDERQKSNGVLQALVYRSSSD